jgi:hypothetical protein
MVPEEARRARGPLVPRTRHGPVAEWETWTQLPPRKRANTWSPGVALHGRPAQGADVARTAPRARSGKAGVGNGVDRASERVADKHQIITEANGSTGR